MSAIIRNKSFEAIIITILFTTVISIIFYPAVFQRQLIYNISEAGSDSLDLNIPRRYLAVQSILKNKEFPLWEQKIGCGVPLFAESEAGILHPTFLFYFLDNITLATNLTVLSAILIAMLGSYTWCRCLGLQIMPSMVAAPAFGLSEIFLLRTQCLNIIHVICLLPISLALIHLFFTTAHKRYVFLLTVVWTLQLVASHFNMAAICLMCCLLYTLFLFCTSINTTKNHKTIVAQIFLALCFSFLLGMIQILPTYELTNHSIRMENQSLEHLADLSPTLRMFKIFINPFYPAWLGDTALQTPRHKMSLYAYDVFQYIGFLPFILCFNTIRRNTTAITVGFWLLTIFFLTISMGPKFGIFTLLFKYCPFVRFFHSPGRFSIPAMCFMTMLSAIGAQNLGNWIKLHYNARISNTVLAMIIIITCFDLGYVNSQVQNYLPSNWITPPLTLYKIGEHQRIYSPYNFMAWQTDIDSYYKDNFIQSAFWRHRSLLSPGIAPLWGIEVPDDYVCYGFGLSSINASVRQITLYSLMQHIMHLDMCNAIKLNHPINANNIYKINDWIRLLSITHIISPTRLPETYPESLFTKIEKIAIPEISDTTSIYIYTLAKPVERIRLVSNLQTKMPADCLNLEKIAYVKNNDSNEITSLFDNRLYEPNFSNPENIGSIFVEKSTNNTMIINTVCDKNAYLVISNTFDPNWKASVDGKPVPIKITNLFMQSLEIPQGKHHVELHYISPAFELGWKISLTALIVFLSAAVVASYNRKRLFLLRRKKTVKI